MPLLCSQSSMQNTGPSIDCTVCTKLLPTSGPINEPYVAVDKAANIARFLHDVKIRTLEPGRQQRLLLGSKVPVSFHNSSPNRTVSTFLRPPTRQSCAQ